MSIPERWDKFAELPSDIKQRLPQLIPLFEREGVQLAYLFGSLAAARRGMTSIWLSLDPERTGLPAERGYQRVSGN
jgi:hypothetical protein